MTNLTNFIRFKGKDFDKSEGAGRISTLDKDIEITAVPFKSNNENAPTHQIFAKSPGGFDVQIGGIWKKKNKQNNDFYTLSIRPLKFNANLGRYPSQDDRTLQAIIEWEPQQDKAA